MRSQRELGRQQDGYLPDVDLAAVHRAGRERISEAAPYLVDRLSDSEEEVRMFAVLALEKITGQARESHEYRYYHPAARREKAVDWWRQRIREWHKGAASSQPAGAANERLSRQRWISA